MTIEDLAERLRVTLAGTIEQNFKTEDRADAKWSIGASLVGVGADLMCAGVNNKEAAKVLYELADSLAVIE